MKLENKEFGFNGFTSEMAKLRNEKYFGYLVTVAGEDFGVGEGLGCIYILEDTNTHERCSVKQLAKKAGEEHVIPSVYNIRTGADLLEREIYDFYGVRFLGHPDMRRLYLRSDFKGYPLRKDYNMDPAKSIYTTGDDVELDTTTEWNLNNNGKLVGTQRPLFTDDNFIVNIGPQHPSTHGVLRLQAILDGETVTKIYPHLGYIHRGIEKLCEQFTCPQTLALTDHTNYLSAMIHRHALVDVIKEGTGIELSEHILYIRVTMDELQRIDNHLLYASRCAQDLGALTAFLCGVRDREHALNVMEETTGGRLIQNYYRIGGLQADIDPDFVSNVRKSCKYLRLITQEYLGVFGNSTTIHERFRNVGVMDEQDCISYGVIGPAGRAGGWESDVRKNHPYAMYDKVNFEQVTLTHGDSMDRCYCHIQEIHQSPNIVEQLTDSIPEGEFYIKQKPIIKVPEGQWYFAVEGASGGFGAYLDSRGDKAAYRLKFRPMGLTLAGAMDEMSRDQKTADLVTTGAALDFVIPDVDR